MNNEKAAVEWLERAAANGLRCYLSLESDPNLAGIRQGQLFKSFREKLKARYEADKADLNL
jgi:hypothetical protein